MTNWPVTSPIHLCPAQFQNVLRHSIFIAIQFHNFVSLEDGLVQSIFQWNYSFTPGLSCFSGGRGGMIGWGEVLIHEKEVTFSSVNEKWSFDYQSDLEDVISWFYPFLSSLFSASYFHSFSCQIMHKYHQDESVL